MFSLVTCTGGRPDAFALLEEWIAAQQFHGRFEWIVVDDVAPATVTRLGQKVIRPTPLWTGVCTLGRNLAAGLAAASGDLIAIIEDDELYLPGYLATMGSLLAHSQLAGQVPARYYHVGRRCFNVISNFKHASLCQTAFRRTLIPRVLDLCRTQKSPFIDRSLWEDVGHESLLVEPDGVDAGVVSIKGMPGRRGIGAGHRPGAAWHPDPNLEQLAAWVTPARATRYARFEHAVSES